MARQKQQKQTQPGRSHIWRDEAQGNRDGAHQAPSRVHAPADFGPSPREHASSRVFEGRDTVGKGGAIRRIVDALGITRACEYEARSRISRPLARSAHTMKSGSACSARSGTLRGARRAHRLRQRLKLEKRQNFKL